MPNEAIDPALSDAKEWINALKDRRRYLLGELGSLDKQLGRFEVGQVMPSTPEIRRFWLDNQGCCPYCGRELMRRGA